MKPITNEFNTNNPPPEPRNTEANTNTIAWGAAIGVHLLLALIFAFLNVGWRYDIPEWVEVEFVSANKKAAIRKAPSRRQAPQPKSETLEEAKKQDEPKNIVNLPKRRMLEDEDPMIRSERRVDFTPDKEVSGALQKQYNDRKPDFDVPRTQKDGTGKISAEFENLGTGEKTIQAGVPDFGKSIAVPFEIEGEASNRTVLQKVLPQYPPGLTREAVVKLRFSVLPNGVVANIVPLLKGDATLEKIALEAFRQWRFNALPAGLEQKNQHGVITFRFVLK